jgi:1-acyl-sn-glycerol-3-phosphate acyltransferase
MMTETGVRGSPRGDASIGWAFGLGARVAREVLHRLIMFPLLALVTPVTVLHRQRLDAVTGPVVVVANHVSHLDTPVILRVLPAAVRRRLVVAAARDYFYTGRLRGSLLSLSLATIPFDRGEGSAESLAVCERLIRGGWSVVVFPEGTRSRTGSLGRVRRGVAVLAASTDTPVLPIYIHGLSRVMPKGTRAPLPGGVAVAVGELVLPCSDVDEMRERVDAALHHLSVETPSWGISTELGDG